MNTTEKLKVILDEHYLWLTTNATEGRAADLRSADLRSADLRGADLTSADLTSAGLTGADGTYSMFYGGKHSAWATCSHIGIGCKMLTHAEWRKQYATIGVRYGYTPAEIERYHAWIISLDWLIEMAPAV